MRWPKRVPILAREDLYVIALDTWWLRVFGNNQKALRAIIDQILAGNEYPHTCWNRAMRSLGYTEDDGYMDI